MVPRSSVGLGLPIFDILLLGPGWGGYGLFFAEKCLSLELPMKRPQGARKRKKKGKEKEIERKKNCNGNAEEGGKAAENGISFLQFFFFFSSGVPFLRSDCAERAEGPTGPPSKERAPGVTMTVYFHCSSFCFVLQRICTRVGFGWGLGIPPLFYFVPHHRLCGPCRCPRTGVLSSLVPLPRTPHRTAKPADPLLFPRT